MRPAIAVPAITPIIGPLSAVASPIMPTAIGAMVGSRDAEAAIGARLADFKPDFGEPFRQAIEADLRVAPLKPGLVARIFLIGLLMHAHRIGLA